MEASTKLRQPHASAEEAVAQRELETRRRQLSTEIDELAQAHGGSLRRKAELHKAAADLAQAAERAHGWKAALRDQVNSAIANAARRHQLRIERHFKSLIPSPHQFDRVVLEFVNDEQQSNQGEPRLFLSNAQANVLAIAIFLSFGASKRWARLDALLLDDPVQHLDDLDAISFLDTLRATALGRFGLQKQILVSTCNRNLYLMMLKKFRAIESEGLKFRGVSLVGQGPAGPEVIYDHGAPERAEQTG